MAALSSMPLALLYSPALAQMAVEEDLTDDAPLGEMGNYDALFFGPAPTRAVKSAFRFPEDVDVDLAYGIDISHHSRSIPWSSLKAAKVNYAYIKSSQSITSRDPMFGAHWKSARDHGVPCGAYHWLTPGVSGADQGAFFARRMKEVGVTSGDLQPVIDLEWDFLGKSFKRTTIGSRRARGRQVPIYKDYWSDIPAADIVKSVNACVQALVAAMAPIAVSPIIYTNKSWWDAMLPASTRLTCPLWPSDYRDQSFRNGVPRAISGHTYNLWQFTDRGRIVVGNESHGPFDCNKIVRGDLAKLTIA